MINYEIKMAKVLGYDEAGGVYRLAYSDGDKGTMVLPAPGADVLLLFEFWIFRNERPTGQNVSKTDWPK